MKNGIEQQKLGKRVNEVRNKKKLSIAQLAAAIGVETGSLANIESGNASPSSELLFSLAEALEVPVDYLVADSLRNKSVVVDYMMYDMLVSVPGPKREQLINMVKAILSVVPENNENKNIQ